MSLPRRRVLHGLTCGSSTSASRPRKPRPTPRQPGPDAEAVHFHKGHESRATESMPPGVPAPTRHTTCPTRIDDCAASTSSSPEKASTPANESAANGGTLNAPCLAGCLPQTQPPLRKRTRQPPCCSRFRQWLSAVLLQAAPRAARAGHVIKSPAAYRLRVFDLFGVGR
jgi:hypothetical protein